MTDISLAKRVVESLARRGLTLAVAESCTGGSIAAAITAVPGASRVLVGGVVAYSAQAKRLLLGLTDGDLPPGCVGSELTALMAVNIASQLATDLGLGITGALGPASPSKTVQVGEVYIAISGLGAQQVKRFIFTGDRQTNNSEAVAAALALLSQHIARW